MKKSLPFWFAVALNVAVLPFACRSWPQANDDVKKARAILQAYHDATAAKNATETAKVEDLYQKMNGPDGALANLEKLTQ